MYVRFEDRPGAFDKILRAASGAVAMALWMLIYAIVGLIAAAVAAADLIAGYFDGFSRWNDHRRRRRERKKISRSMGIR